MSDTHIPAAVPVPRILALDPGTQAAVETVTYYVVAEFAEESEQTGSAFCIGAQGLLMTCAHVVSRTTPNGIEVAQSVYVSSLVGGVTAAYEADVAKNGNPAGPMLPENMNDPDGLDLALLQITLEGNYPWLALAGEDPAVGADCTSFGAFENPDEDVEYSVAEGSVTAVWQNANGVTALIRHDCPIVQGFSGGPLVDDNGNVLGVNALAYPGQDSRYAIAGAIAWDFVPDA